VLSPAVENLVAQLSRLPGVGTRTAHRLAFHLLQRPKDEALALSAAIARAVRVPVIASGGVGILDHLYEGLEAGADAVLAASIFHYRECTIGQVKRYLAERGVAVRPV